MPRHRAGRVDGVEDDAIIQHERAVNLISTQAGSLATVRLPWTPARSSRRSPMRSPPFVAVRQKRCDIAAALLEKGADAVDRGRERRAVPHPRGDAGPAGVPDAPSRTAPTRPSTRTARRCPAAAAIKGYEMGIINKDIIDAPSSRPARMPRWTHSTPRGSRTIPRPRAPRRRRWPGCA